MAHQNEEKIADELTDFLLKLKQQRDRTKLSKEAGELIFRMTPRDIALAEKRLFQNGLTPREIHRLSATFIMLGLLDADVSDLRSRLQDHHILRKVMAEHEMTRCFIADLETVADQIAAAKTLSPASGEVMRLAHIVEHLNSLEEHMDRENDVLFPALREYGWESMFAQVETEHTYIKMSIEDIVKLVMAMGKMPLENFKTRLLSTVHYLCPLMRDHMLHEDQILFPLAVAMLPNDEVWTRLRNICNEIGYCGVHL